MENIPIQDISVWRTKLQSMRPSTVLREIASTYAVGRMELASMLSDLYCAFGTPEVQAVWHWDISNCGSGVSDEGLDQLLLKLETQHTESNNPR
jgi:hypothetical protein